MARKPRTWWKTPPPPTPYGVKWYDLSAQFPFYSHIYFPTPKPKSMPSQLVPIPSDEPPSQYACLIPQNTLSSVTSLADISFPDVQQVYYTTLAIESTRQKELTLPFDTTCHYTTVHHSPWRDFSRSCPSYCRTAFRYLESLPQTSDNLTSLPASTRTPSPQTWDPETQNQEMTQAGSGSITDVVKTSSNTSQSILNTIFLTFILVCNHMMILSVGSIVKNMHWNMKKFWSVHQTLMFS